MKTLFIIIATTAVGLVGCSSSKKSDSPATTAQAEAKTSTPKVTPLEMPAKKVAKPAASATGDNTVASCTYGRVKREVTISQANEKCTVQYVKDGTAQEVATGALNSSFCTEVADRIKNNLAAAGYKCE